MASDCIFCRIISGELPGQLVYQDDQVVAFRDINPVAPVHVLVVPRQHIESLATVEAAHHGLAGRLLWACAEVARSLGIEDRGYRVAANVGEDSGNQVPHLHLHVLGGRRLHGMG
jgi:histidine triad (HIT) family protein